MNRPDKSLLKVLESGSEYLASHDVENPRLACELLATRLLGCKRLELYMTPEAMLSEPQIEAMRRGIKRVAEQEPVQYVTGEAQFHQHIFKVDKRALIPRPETEILVDIALKTETLWNREKPVIADVGTGCGCIAITLSLAHPEAYFVATDINPEALDLAKENARRLDVPKNTVFTCGELCDNVEPESLDAVIANLPYIATSQYEKLPAHIREYEPRSALDGGQEGMSVISAVAQDASIALKNKGMIFLEIGEDQGAKTTTLLREIGFDNIEIRPDLAGKDRIVLGQLG